VYYKALIRAINPWRKKSSSSKKRRRRAARKKKRSEQVVRTASQRRSIKKPPVSRPTKFFNLLDVPYVPWTLNVGYKQSRRMDRRRKRSVYPVSEQKIGPLTIKKPRAIRRPTYLAKHISGVARADDRGLLVCRKRYSRRVALFALRRIGLGMSGPKNRKMTLDSKVRC
jgi:hypothetical protein